MRWAWLGVWVAVGVVVSCASHPRPTAVAAAAEKEKAFTAFESGAVRPLALSSAGRYLYATNTPDNRLEIFDVSSGTPRSVASVPVGLEPVAVAERTPGEVWVVNLLSDSVSVIDTTDPATAHVVATLLVGDEPRDIVFAGAGRSRAFVTTAHRGQNTGRDPQLTTPGIGRADVWVFDANSLGTSLTGKPLTVLSLFADTPRALAVSPDGSTVYAAAFYSGNQTLSLPETTITPGGGLPPPHTNAMGQAQPPTGLIVKYKIDSTDGQRHWLDSAGRRWDSQVLCTLPDKDVFAIDAMAEVPAVRTSYSGVGTVLFNMAVNPATGKVYVSNTDARNDVRFEGHDLTGGAQGAPPGTVLGHFMESRITVIDTDAAQVEPRHLNKNIDYAAPGTAEERATSLAFPTDMAVSPDGATLFVAALGSSKIGIYSTAELERDTFVPATVNEVSVSGGGPTGLVLDAARGQLYVLTRFDDALSVVNIGSRSEVAHVPMFNPEPQAVVAGRRFLYDATYTSGHGDSACAGCHVFGDMDGLAWDLGDPDDYNTPVPGPYTVPQSYRDLIAPAAPAVDASVKGPMTTQSLRGMANHGPMHWRGDRTGGTDSTRLNVVPSSQPDTGTFDERAAFKKFNVAFAGLMGRSGPLTDDEMNAFTDYILLLTYPPNPIRNLDNSLTPDQQIGHDFYFNHTPDGQEIPSDSFHNCNGCHTLDPTGNAQYNVAKPGFFGTDGRYEVQTSGKYFKVPQLRNLYQKVGMFQTAGDQVRGFGFLHDGSFDTIFRFHGQFVFEQHDSTLLLPANPNGFQAETSTDPATAAAQKAANGIARRKVEAFVLAYDSNLAPIVGQQATLSSTSGADIAARIELLEARAKAGECDVVVKGISGGALVEFLFDPATGAFRSARAADPDVTDEALRAMGRTGFLTFTAVPPGSGVRIGLDRDSNGILDGDER